MFRDAQFRDAQRSYVPLVAGVALASFLQWLGSSAVLPLLPLYLQRRGSSDAMVGIVMGAFFAAGVLAQYVSGHLADRVGHRSVLLFGLLGYAVFSAAFLLDVGGTGYALLRAGQGASAGAAEVAMLALVTWTVPAHVRGRAVSAVFGGQLAGIAVGPLVGSAVGVAHMGSLFVVSSLVAVLAGIPVLLTVGSGLVAGNAGATHGSGREHPDRGPARRVLTGVLVTAVTAGLLTGIYETCWTLLLDLRGASTWQIGLSWTLFALPFVLAMPVAGWAADHHDRRLLVVVGLIVPIVLAVVYPWLADVRWLIGLGVLESLGIAFAYPAVQSLLTEAVPADAVGRAQGRFVSVQTAAIAVSAGASGGLFAVAPWVPFTVAAVVSLGLIALLPLLWRGTSGRVARPDPVTERRRSR